MWSVVTHLFSYINILLCVAISLYTMVLTIYIIILYLIINELGY